MAFGCGPETHGGPVPQPAGAIRFRPKCIGSAQEMCASACPC